MSKAGTVPLNAPTTQQVGKLRLRQSPRDRGQCLASKQACPTSGPVALHTALDLQASMTPNAKKCPPGPQDCWSVQTLRGSSGPTEIISLNAKRSTRSGKCVGPPSKEEEKRAGCPQDPVATEQYLAPSSRQPRATLCVRRTASGSCQPPTPAGPRAPGLRVPCPPRPLRTVGPGARKSVLHPRRPPVWGETVPGVSEMSLVTNTPLRPLPSRT